MALDMGGAAGGAQMLQDVLARKLQEQQVYAQQKMAQAKLAEDIRQANMQNEVQKGNLALGGRRVGLDESQFADSKQRYAGEAGLRAANEAHLGAETTSLQNAPGEAEKGRTFMAGQNAAAQANAVRIANINGVNQMNVANVRHPDGSAAAAEKQANEVQDTLDLLDSIESDKALPTAVGPIDSYGLGFARDPSGVNRFANLHNQLVGRLQLANAGKLKGQGAVSDAERQMLRQASTALNRDLSEADYRGEIKKIRGSLQRMLPGANPATANVVVNANADPLGLFAKK